MKYHKQTLTVKEHGHGNCYQTTLACILDVEIYEVIDIALFYNLIVVENNWFQILQSWLKQKYKVREIFIPELKEYHNNLINLNINEDTFGRFPLKYKDIPYMVVGTSPRGIRHVVIYINGKMVHDVHPDNSGVLLDETSSYSILEKCEVE